MTESRGINEMHGMYGTPAYNVWWGMRSRCDNTNNPAYINYGARGIAVCARWSLFANFLADMGEPPEGMTIERSDNSKGYSKENCVWAGRTTQNRNKRNVIFLTIDGETLPAVTWADRHGLKYHTVRCRLRAGWTPEAAIKTPLVTVRKGVPRGQAVHAFGDKHGVIWSDPKEVALREMEHAR